MSADLVKLYHAVKDTNECRKELKRRLESLDLSTTINPV